MSESFLDEDECIKCKACSRIFFTETGFQIHSEAHHGTVTSSTTPSTASSATPSTTLSATPSTSSSTTPQNAMTLNSSCEPTTLGTKNDGLV